VHSIQLTYDYLFKLLTRLNFKGLIPVKHFGTSTELPLNPEEAISLLWYDFKGLIPVKHFSSDLVLFCEGALKAQRYASSFCPPHYYP